MADPAKVLDQNLLPVQAYFAVDGTFQTFIGQGQPFYATLNPNQSGLAITLSTLDSSPIGSITPSTGVFTNISTTTGSISTTPTANTDIANKYYVDQIAQGLSPKQAVKCGTTGNITLSGLQTIDGYTTLAGDRVLVKNQSTSSQNGIYIASSTAWTRSVDMDVWSEVPGAYTVILNGSANANTAWVCTASDTGTINVTAMPWVQFSGSGTYFAGTGLTLASNTFSITPVGAAGTYGSASSVPVFITNASGQVTSVTNTSIAISGSQITSGTIGSSYLSGSYTGITGVGTLTAGTWNASTIGVAYGGTGATTFTAGYLKASGTTAFSTVTSIPNTDITGLGTMSTQNANAVAITGGTITTLTNPLAVNSGGTGASTLTGYVKGSGTAALTASSTIPNTDISGLGTMSTQNANAVAITGGTINGTSIGATTRASGDFTTLSANTVTNTTPVLSFNASNSIASFGSTTANSYNQLVIQNKSTSASSSTNYVISNDLGTDSTYYGEFGMNSSVYSSSTPADFFSLNNGIYLSGHDGDLSFGSGNGYKSYFAWGTSGQSAHVINSTGALGFSTNLGTTPALSGTTGFGTSGQALVTAGSTAAPAWGVVGIIGGGTNGTATPTAGAVAYGTGTAYAFTAAGTTGQVLQSNGSSAPTWTTPTAYATVTDDTTTGATRYPLFANQTAGNLTTEYVSSTKLQYNPQTGVFTSTSFSGAGTGLTGTASGLSIGGNAATATSATSATTATNLAGGAANQIPYQTGAGATSFITAPTISSTALTWNGSAFTWATAGTAVTISDDTTTNATRYPLFANATSGTVSTEYVSSTKLKYNPSTGELTAPEQISSNGIMVNSATVSTSYTIATGTNGFSVGPLTINSGVTITVSSGQRHVII